MASIKCEQCGKWLHPVSDSADGRIRCPACEAANTMPPAGRDSEVGKPGPTNTASAAGRELRASAKKHSRLVLPIALGLGVSATVATGVIELAYPRSLEALIRGYSLAAYVGIPAIRLVGYAVVLGLVALGVSWITHKGRRAAYPVFAWLFLLAGLLDVVTTATLWLPAHRRVAAMVGYGLTAAARQDAAARRLGLPKYLIVDLGNGATMKCVLIAPGRFTAGSPLGEKGRNHDEGPQHEVTISKPFYMSVHEVTKMQYDAVIPPLEWVLMTADELEQKKKALEAASLTSHITDEQIARARKREKEEEEEKKRREITGGPVFTARDFPSFEERYRVPLERDNAPVTFSWNEASEFCRKLARKSGRAVRLPTEAEWEYACRAGSVSAYCFGDDESALGGWAWYHEKGRDEPDAVRPGRVGRKKANAWGLHDMHGNLWEWCADWYGRNYYHSSPSKDPQGPRSGKYRVLRGGSCGSRPAVCRSAVRNMDVPDAEGHPYGLRVVIEVPEVE